MNIIYIGQYSGTSGQRAKALERLGHNVTIINPWKILHRTALSTRIHYHSGYFGASIRIKNFIINNIKNLMPDLVWINQGEFIGPSVVQAINDMSIPVINYANDNPFSPDNKRRFSQYLRALPYYDLVVVVFDSAFIQAKKYGAKKVLRKFIAADEVAHLGYLDSELYNIKYYSNVNFVGTWLNEERSRFIVKLIELGLPITIYGDNWCKAKEWKVIQPYWKGPGVYDPYKYASLLYSSDICLGLLNKKSGNLHTDRSIQIPAMGALLCAERTREHLEMYYEDKEAVFWSNAEECSRKCFELLKDKDRIKKIKENGRLRAIKNNLFNEPILNSILEEIFN